MLGKNTPSGGLWKVKVGDHWDGKRNQLCSQRSNVQLNWNLLSSTKTSLQKNEMIFLFWTNVLNICFSCPIPKMIQFGVHRRAKFLQHIKLKKLKMDHMGWNDRPWSQWDTFFNPRTTFDCRILHQQRKKWMKQQTSENCSVLIAIWRLSKTGPQHT